MFRPGLSSAVVILFVSTTALAKDWSVPAAGGLQALTTSLDLARGKLRYGTCAIAPCAVTGEVAINMSPTHDFNVEGGTIDLAGGRTAVWVHVAGAGTATWDAVLAGAPNPLLYAEQTGLVNGQPGDVSGRKVKTIPDGAGHQYIVRGSTSEGYTICGREAVAYPEILDPHTLQWKRASFLQLSPADVAGAVAIDATARQASADKPLAPLLSARFASSGEHPGAIADGDPATAWTHASVGKGRGEFVSFNAPSDVPITRFTITVAPTTPQATGAAPKTFFLATADHVLAVTMPEDAWSHPGRAYDIALPEPIKSSCLALVLDDAFVRPNATAVSIAELTAYSELDVPGATLESAAADLGAGGRRAEAAAGVLKRASSGALGPVEKAWPKLDSYGHELALDVAAAAPCGSEGTQVFLAGLCDADRHVARKAESALLQCKAKADIVAAVAAVPQAQCPKVAQYLALLGGAAALEPLVSRMAAASDTAARTEVRHHVATAAQRAPTAMLATMLGDARYTPLIRLELLRAMTPRLAEVSAEGLAAVESILGNKPDLGTRYLALEPLAALARDGKEAALSRFASMLASDPDWPVRARAAELARDLPSLAVAVAHTAADEQPRVRQSALETLGALHAAAAARAIEQRLASDAWTFVRVAAADALAALPPGHDVDESLGTVLGTDTAMQVRVAVLGALASHHARDQIPAVRARLDDVHELGDVRVEAIRTLGAMCDAAQLDRLTELASAAADPMADAEDLGLGLASVVALGDMHPNDLGRRLAKLRDKSVRDAVRNAAEHALASPPKCHP